MAAPAVPELPLNLNFRGNYRGMKVSILILELSGKRCERTSVPTLINCFLESKEIGYEGRLLYLVNKAMINSFPIALSSPLIPINHIC